MCSREDGSPDWVPAVAGTQGTEEPMATEVLVPTLGESITEATLGEWLKQPGDAVRADEYISGEPGTVGCGYMYKVLAFVNGDDACAYSI